MQQFQIILKNEKKKQYERIAFFIIIANIAAFIFLSFVSTSKAGRISFLVGAVSVFICLGIDYFLTRIKNNEDTPYRLFALFVISMVWINSSYWWIGIILFVPEMFYLVSKRPLLVIAGKDKIIYPSFPIKNIVWPSLNNVILKDGLLTIDLKNNRLIQQAIDDSKTSVNEQEFNDFCREQLSK